MTSTAVRLVRAAVVALLLVLLLPALPAGAAGTGGVEVTPLPAVVDGEPVTAFHVRMPRGGSKDVPFALRNLTANPRTATLYAASATRSPDGGYAIGGPGSSPHVRLAEERVTLGAKAFERRTFRLRGAIDSRQYAAVVVEVRNGSVVTRAATLVYLQPASELPVPLLLVLVAAAVLLAAAVAVGVTARRRRASAATAAA